MIGVAELETLLGLMRANGVQRFKCPEVEIELSPRAWVTNPVQPDDIVGPAKGSKEPDDDEDTLFYSAAKR